MSNMNSLEELFSLYGSLPSEEQLQLKQQADAIIGNLRWIPQFGPQTEAYFSPADETLYGGAAGGGKTDLLTGTAINLANRSTIFRAAFKDLKDLELRSIEIMGTNDGYNASDKLWQLGKGRIISFGALGKPGSELNWQGRRRDFMGFDEAANLQKKRVAFVLGWATKRIIYATNPPLSAEGEWLIIWFAPWLDPFYPKPAKHGELRWFVNNAEGDPVWVDGPGTYDRGDGKMSSARSRTFIPSLLKDNAYLGEDYRRQVESLPEPMRTALLEGNFMAARRDDAWQVVPSDWIRAAQQRWKEGKRNNPMVSMGVDVAQGGSNKTAIAKLHTENFFDDVLTERGIDTKDGKAVAGLVIKEQRNGCPVGVDCTGGWGGDAVTQLVDSHQDVIRIVYSEVTGWADPASKIQAYNLRAEMHWNMRLALNPKSGENIALPPGNQILAQGSAARWTLKGGKILVEDKQQIIDRLGSGVDEWDSIITAWHIRGRGLEHLSRKQMGEKEWNKRQGFAQQGGEADPFDVDGF